MNIRVPMSLIRSGVKLAALVPGDATSRMNEKLREKGIGIDVGNLKSEDLDQLVDALADMEVDVQGGKEHVRVFGE